MTLAKGGRDALPRAIPFSRFSVQWHPNTGAMPPEEYGNKAEVMRSAHTPAEPDQDPSVKAAQAHDKKHQRIAEPLRDVEPTEVHE